MYLLPEGDAQPDLPGAEEDRARLRQDEGQGEWSQAQKWRAKQDEDDASARQQASTEEHGPEEEEAEDETGACEGKDGDSRRGQGGAQIEE